MSKHKIKIKVIHNSPGKKGKQEYREFATLEEADQYIQRNTQEGRFPGRLKKK